MTSIENEENALEEYEESFKLEVTTGKGSSIKVETSSYSKLRDLVNEALNTYNKLKKEESTETDEQKQYQ
ncbi:MAG TPA: hypothetical protein VFP49_06080 [Nitrososphaeraceae archaeon]|jgi:hypothetical protein|nr:hypothetical protein [Nitrososphaeraceae archaeon]